jgi:solute:Na+ symporter, SSS family
MVVGILHNAASREHWLTYGSQMGANFYGAIYAWAAATVMAVGVSLFTVRKQRNQLAGLVFELRIDEKGIAASPVWILALLLAAACVGLNVWLR